MRTRTPFFRGQPKIFDTIGDAEDAGFQMSAFQVGCNHARYAELAWRAKRIRLTVNVTENGASWVGNGTFEKVMWEAPGFTPSSERDLVVATMTTAFSTIPSFSDPNNGLQLIFFTHPLIVGGYVLFSLALALAGAKVNGTIYPDGVTSIPGPFTTGPSPVTFTAFGQSIPMYTFLRGTSAGKSYSGACLLEIVEWWPYAKADGTEPIWDAVSGAQLLDPRR